MLDRFLNIIDKNVLAFTSIDEFDQYVSPVLEHLLRYEKICVYIRETNKAYLRYTSSKYEVSSLKIEKGMPFYDVFAYGKKAYRDISKYEKVFLKSDNAISCVAFPLRNKTKIIGIVIFLYTKTVKLDKRLIRLSKSASKMLANIYSKTETNVFFNKKRKIYSKRIMEEKSAYKKAQMIQRHLNTINLPLIENYCLSAYYKPSEALGGDFFNVIVGASCILIVFADSVGNGIEACMDATLLKAISDRYICILQEKHPDEFLSRVNFDLTNYYRTRFPAMMALVIEIETGICHYASAGNVLPYIKTKNGVKFFPRVSGMLLGYNINTKYEKGMYRLLENDVLFVYSDIFDTLLFNKGKTNSFEETRKYYMDMVSKMGRGVSNDISEVVSNLKKLSSHSLDDDATFVILERVPEKRFLLDFENVSDIAVIEEKLHSLMKLYNFTEKDQNAVSLALFELADNALRHGKKDSSKKCSAECRINAKEICIEINDFGKGFDYKDVLKKFEKQDKLIPKDNLENGKRGIFITMKAVDKLEYHENGSIVSIIKKRSQNKTLFDLPKRV